MNKKYPVIILVEPQMGENIGFIARSMKNFELCTLRIIKPRDGWPNQKATSSSANAKDIIENAQIFENLQEASQDLEYLYASSSLLRDMNKPIILSKDLNSKFKKELKCGIVFGRENSGLKNDEITYCNEMIKINTSEFSSLNISHAAAIIFYEIFQYGNIDINYKSDIASKNEYDHFINHLINNLEDSNFFTVPEKKNLMTRNITNIFNRIDNITKQEINTLRGILKSFEKK